MSDYGRFRHHRYQWTHPFTGTRHWWELVGPEGGIHFHVSIQDKAEYPPSAGLEFHHTAGHPEYAGQAPHHIKCPLIGGPCWHDGTSLYATEELWPMIECYLRDGDHQSVFRVLEREYDKHFRKEES